MPDDITSLKARLEQLETEVLRLTRSNTSLEDQQAIMARQAMYRENALDIKDMVDTFTTDLKLYKNMVYNSSFEVPGVNQTPTYWTGGTATADASWYDTCSLRLSAGHFASQTSTAWIDPDFYGREKTRVSFWHKFARLRCEVLNEADHVIATHDYGWAADWPAGRRTFTFDPGESAQIYLKFTNLESDASKYAYIDAVQLEPDKNGRMPSLYTDGPYSAGGTGSSFFDTAGVAVAEFGAVVEVTSAEVMPAIPTISVVYVAATSVVDDIRISGSGLIDDWAPAYFVGRSSVSLALDGVDTDERLFYQVIEQGDFEPTMPVDGAVELLLDSTEIILDVHATGYLTAVDVPDFTNLLTQQAPWDQASYFAGLAIALDSAYTYSESITTGSGAATTTVLTGATAAGALALTTVEFINVPISASVGSATATTVLAGLNASGAQSLTRAEFSVVVINTGGDTLLTTCPPLTDGDSTSLTAAGYVPVSNVSTNATVLVA